MNKKTTESFHVSSQLLYGAMIGPTGSTGRVLSPLSLGKFIDFTETPHYSAACTDQSKNMSPIIESISTNHLTDWGLGDWVPVRSKSNITLTSSIYYYTDVCILAKAARLFGYAEDASYYNTLAQKIKRGYQHQFSQ